MSPSALSTGDNFHMSRGHLRVYLGLAPGVGKTYRMLDEGFRRRERGADVVAAYVESHKRPLTDAQLRDLEVIPRTTFEYRGAHLEEMNLEAVLERHPEVALVDELAHTNAPGSANEKRWQDVEALLDAGIDVITTVNIQHLESVNDVVEKITGIVQQETVPDFVVRRAEQIELVDITPEALRRRLAHGNIYPAEKIDASLSNFFRSGNLSALRELSLLWLADRVEDSLQSYLDAHDIKGAWETRERLIVAVTGSEADEVLLRRAARIAARNHAQLLAVHVVDAGKAHRDDLDTTLARDLVTEFEGTFHEVVDEDIAGALVAFARAERGTQIVLGSSRRRRLLRIPGVVENVLRQARDLDVHIISVTAPQPAKVHQRGAGTSLISLRRLAAGLGAAAVLLPLLTFVMSEARSSLSLSTVFLVYLVAVLALTAWSGVAVGVVAAIASSGLENYYFVNPLHTLEVARPDDLVAIIAFLVFAVGASLIVTGFASRSHDAQRARAEAEILAKAAATVATTREELIPLLDSLRAVFLLPTVALLEKKGDQWVTDLVSGEPVSNTDADERFEVNDETVLIMTGAKLDTQDRQLVTAFAGRIAAGLESQKLAREATALKATAEADALRIGLLRTVSHDLRPALAKIETSVTALLRVNASWSPSEQRHYLNAIAQEVNNLTRMVTNLLDSGRLDAKLVAPRSRRAALIDLVNRAIETIDTQGRIIEVDFSDELPLLTTDPDLLERVIANVVSNACEFSPEDQVVRLSAGLTSSGIELLVIDRGPGTREAERRIPKAQLEEETSEDIGLSVASGFITLLGGELRFEDTPGGGLTVVIELSQDLPATPVTSPHD
jgi:two-component system sensor histidine kinase KdpD